MSKTKFKVPEWHGRHPFPPEKKKPTLISRDKILHFLLYGKTAYTDMNWLLASTDRIHVGIYLIPPGGRFDPPDIHAGEEVSQSIGHIDDFRNLSLHRKSRLINAKFFFEPRCLQLHSSSSHSLLQPYLLDTEAHKQLLILPCVSPELFG